MMKKRVFLWALAAVFFCFCSLIWSPAFSVSADIEPQPVELSLEQTFALYGYQFDGVGYTSSNGTSRIPFYYVCRSSELRDLQHLTFWNYYQYGPAVDQLVSDFNSQEFLLYACDASLINDDSHHLFTAYVPFSLNIENIQFYRQRFWYSTQTSGSLAVYASSLSSHRSTAELYSTVSASAYQQQTEIYSALREPGNSTDLVGFPLMWSNLRSNGSQYMLGAGLDLYYRPFDSNNQPVNFNVSGLDFYFKNIKTYHVPSTISDWLGASYEGSNPLLDRLLNKDCFFLYVGQPILSDGFDIPSTEPETPDYSEQIDNINTNTATISANLSAILAKLDLIYQNMGSPITGTVNISSSSISSIGSAIQGLFVPSQADLLAWRLNMQNLAFEKLNPFVTAEQLRDSALSSIMNASPVGYVDLPLLDLTDSGVPLAFTSADFPDFQAVDDKLRIPLKTSDSSWSFFYDLIAWAVDIICTIAFVNMLITKLHTFFLGDKVVEVQNDH